MKPHIKIVGLGTVGEKILSLVHKSGVLSKVEHMECFSYSDSYALDVDENEIYSREEILSTAKWGGNDPVLVLLVGAFEGRFATYEIPAMVKFAKGRGFDVGVIATTPFSSEGKSRCTISEEAVRTVKDDADFCIIINNMDLVRNAVTSLVKMVADDGQIVVDYADLRALWKQSNKCFSFISLKQMLGESNEAFCERSRNQLGKRVEDNAKQLIVQVCHGPDFTLSDYNRYLETVVGCFKQASGLEPDIIVSDSKNEDGSDLISVEIWYGNK